MAVITDIEGKKIWDELGFFLGIDLVGFSAYGLKIENSKKKKKKNCKREVLGFEPELIGKKYTKLPLY